jgi:L-fuconolactonase
MYPGPIIDAHIHLWDPRTTPRTVSPLVRTVGFSPALLRAATRRFAPADALSFIGSPDHVLAPFLPGTWLHEADGADVRGFVHVQADWRARTSMGQVGESRWLEQLCGRDLLAVVGRVDLADRRLDAALDGHAEASPRFRGIRDHLAHAQGVEGLWSFASAPDRTAEHAWRRGYDRLGERGLSFDAWAYGHQLGAVATLVAEHPGTPVVLCHLGTPVGAGGPAYGLGATAAERDLIVGRWREDLAAIAAAPHVHVKLSGLGMPVLGFGWHDRPNPPGVEEVADAYGPFVEHALDVFGPSRCMAASNTPVDRVSLPWTTAFAALDRLTSSLDDAARRAVFHDTAARFYRIDDVPDPPPHPEHRGDR